MEHLSVRRAELPDLPQILTVYEYARKFMADTGNPGQWGDTYPLESQILEDIEKNQFYVVEKEKQICGAFAFLEGEDPAYLSIEEGQWRSDREYGSIHRVAGNGTARGVFGEIVKFCETKISHLRIDTHEDNKIMQHLIEKNGFCRCGIIHLANRGVRIGFEKTGSP